MGRAPCCDKARVKKGPWAPEEDAVLKAYLDAHGAGGNWIALPHKIGLNRCGKSCRLRWLNYLRPNIRHGGFTDEEDRIICTLYISIGSRWSTIAAQLPGRTDNDVKNYWNTKLKRRLLGGGRRPVRYYDSVPQSPRLLPSPAGGAAAATSALDRMQLRVQLQRRHGRLQLQEHSPGGFTFYGDLAAPPWAARQPLSPAASGNSEMQLQLQLQPQHRVLSGGNSTGYSGFWSHVQAASSTYTGGVGVQDQSTWDWDSTGGGTPPLSTSTTGETAAGIESSGSTPTASSATLGGGDMEDEIDMLLQQIGGFGENDGQVGGEAVVDGDAGSWSSCSTPGVDSGFQDYVQGFM